MAEYDSVTRSFRATNLAEETLAAPADLTINPTPPALYNIAPGTISPETNLKIRRLGIFCNFADGLVFKNPEQEITLITRLYGLKSQTVPQVGTCSSAGGKTITAVTGDFTGVANGNLIKIGGATGRYVMVEDATGAPAAVDVYQYVGVTPGTPFEVMQVAGAGEINYLRGIKLLNYMHEVNEFLQPGVAALANSTDVLLIAQVGATGTEFLTASINIAFNGEVASFDALMDLQYTEQ